jgi:hypothetical protein
MEISTAIFLFRHAGLDVLLPRAGRDGWMPLYIIYRIRFIEARGF